MNGQSRKLNRLCLTGFLLSVLAPFMVSVGFFFTYYPFWRHFGIWISGRTEFAILIFAFYTAIAFSVIGFILSIKGVRSCGRRGEKGRGLGITGMVVAGILWAAASLILLSVLIIPRESPPKSTVPAVNGYISVLELTYKE